MQVDQDQDQGQYEGGDGKLASGRSTNVSGDHLNRDLRLQSTAIERSGTTDAPKTYSATAL